MLRITTSASNGTICMKLEGKIVGPWVDECRAEWARWRSTGAEVALDLTAVQYADPRGAALLRELAAEGALAGTSSFVAELLRPEAISTRAAREVLVRRHAPALLARARRYLRSEEDAADAVRAAFVAVLGSAPADDQELAAALRRAVVDACIARVRRERADEPQRVAALLPRFDDAGRHAERVEPWRDTDELRAAARRALDELPEAHRLVLALHDVEELAPGEIARRLGTTEAEVRARLHRSRQALITLLRPAPRRSRFATFQPVKTA